MDQGIIWNFKQIYQKIAVRLTLKRQEQEKVKVNLLKILITYKAWENMTHKTVINCFKKCGFYNNITNFQQICQNHKKNVSASGMNFVNDFENVDYQLL